MFKLKSHSAFFIPFLLWAANTQGQDIEVLITDSEGNPLGDAVIELVLDASERVAYQQPVNQEVDQRGKEFIPTVSIVTAGSSVNFPNSDDILHHVYSFSQPKTFNIPLYGRGENADYQEVFPNSGVIEIGCNIHDWMLAYIYVAETSLAALSDETGRARIENTPVGQYQLRIWHPRAAGSSEDLSYTISLTADQTTNLDLSLELQRDREYEELRVQAVVVIASWVSTWLQYGK